MLKAWNAGKLGRAFAEAGLDTRELRRTVARSEDALRRTVARSEDALTSSVLGRISYLPGSRAWRLLAEAEPRPLSGHPWPGAPGAEPTWDFWPAVEPPEGDTGLKVEPDVLVQWEPWTLIIEVKNQGVQYAGQWIRQIRAVVESEDVAPERVIYLALGGWRPEDAVLLAGEVQKRIPEARLYSLDWYSLRTAMDRLRVEAELPPGQKSMLEDATTALSSAGYRPVRLFDSLPAVLSEGNRLSPEPLPILSWRSLA